jgi:hypothetical protein
LTNGCEGNENKKMMMMIMMMTMLIRIMTIKMMTMMQKIVTKTHLKLPHISSIIKTERNPVVEIISCTPE